MEDGSALLHSLAGYVVAMVDGRHRNRSRKWANAALPQLGHLETADQIAGARNIAKLPYIDAERMACFGWSYGGYMTLWELLMAADLRSRPEYRWLQLPTGVCTTPSIRKRYMVDTAGKSFGI